MKKTDIVVFDFDGTLSGKDCNLEFGKYCFRHSVRPWFFLPVVVTGIFARFLNPNGLWWREMSRRYLSADLIKRLAPGFIKQHLRERFGWSAERVVAEKSAGNKVLLISAGADYLVPHLVRDMKFDDIITSVTEKSRPWKFKFLCYGENKVIALNKWAEKNKIIPNVVRSYGDSRADRFIMSRAVEQVWINAETGGRK